MNDGDALLAAILADPDDDTPRLVYADWLEENGDAERAEFIRFQCQQARHGTDELDERMFLMEYSNKTKWLAGLPQFSNATWSFRRGFPEELSVPGTLFLERYETFARVPWVRSLYLHDLDNSAVRHFAVRPWNSRWLELSLQEATMLSGIMEGYDSSPALIAVAHCPQVRQLRTLRLSLFAMTRSAARELVESPYFDNLQQLFIEQLRPARGVNSPLFAPLRARFGDRLVLELV